MSNAITRREALAMGGALAGAVALAPLTGCAPANQGWDGSSYLPIGTIVKLKKYESLDIKHMVLQRRPKLSVTYSTDDNGNVTTNKVEGVYDYALLPWPIGFINDVTKEAILVDVAYANTSDISEVVFMGLMDEMERKAQEALESSKAEGTDGNDAVKAAVNQYLKERMG